LRCTRQKEDSRQGHAQCRRRKAALVYTATIEVDPRLMFTPSVYRTFLIDSQFSGVGVLGAVYRPSSDAHKVIALLRFCHDDIAMVLYFM